MQPEGVAPQGATPPTDALAVQLTPYRSAARAFQVVGVMVFAFASALLIL